MHGRLSGTKPPIYSMLRAALGHPVLWRCAVVLTALAVIFWRTPSTFTNPQFWGEDIFFFYGARTEGWASVATPVAGYLISLQYLVAVLASYFDPIFAPAIYNYTAVILTLLVVWLVTSPRLDMPLKPLLALAVVTVPMAYEEIGTLCNIQWILPIGAFAILFMRPSNSRAVLTGEVIFVALMSVSGPFSIFLAPMFFWRAYFAEPFERNRLVLLTAVVGMLGLVQGLTIITHPYPIDAPATPYPRSLWITLPLKQIMTTFGPAAKLFVGIPGAAIGAACLVSAVALACFPPYRTQKVFMLMLSAAIAVGGMLKFRDMLGTQVTAQRYFYAGAVFSLWFICCLSKRPRARTAIAIVVTSICLALLPSIKNTPRIRDDLEWRTWASHISKGIPVTIPTHPAGTWYVEPPPAESGPLAKLNSWIGRDISTMADLDASACSGSMELVTKLSPIILLSPSTLAGKFAANWWSTKGVASAGSYPIDALAITDGAGVVLGFGAIGFDFAGSGSTQVAWRSLFHSRPGAAKAFGVVNEGKKICALQGVFSFPTVTTSLASDRFVSTVELLPGKTITQRFKPRSVLQGASLTFVNFGKTPTSYNIAWTVDAITGDSRTTLGSGRLDASTIRDWGAKELPLLPVGMGMPEVIEISLIASGEAPILPAGIPLYSPGQNTYPAEVDGIPVNGGLQLGLRLTYSE